jgi:hypothetical protein
VMREREVPSFVTVHDDVVTAPPRPPAATQRALRHSGARAKRR